MSDIRERYSMSSHKQDNQNNQSSFQFRLLLAVILFAILFLFDISNTKTAEIAIEKFTRAISADVEDKLESWLELNL